MRPVDPPPSALISLETLTAERVKLNVHIPLLGRSIPIKVDPFPVDDNILGGKDIAKAVMWIQMHCAVGPSGMRPNTSGCGITQRSGRKKPIWGYVRRSL